MGSSEAEDAGGLSPVKDDNEAAAHFIVEAIEKKYMNFFSTLRRKTPQKAAKRLLLKDS